MSRADSLGFFWQDIVKEKVSKERPKRVPPERTWEDPSYLPYLEEALKFDVELMSDAELLEVSRTREYLYFDVELYRNYMMCGFMSDQSRKFLVFEQYEGTSLDYAKLQWVIENCRLVGFNSRSYDLTILRLALAGLSNADLKHASDSMIQYGTKWYDLLREHRLRQFEGDHIDLKEVAPLFASLKIYGGRLHTRRMQDLPFPHHISLSEEQIAVTRWYNVNDLETTKDLRDHLDEQLKLREEMSLEYRMDLRSLSDAQIAERVIVAEVAKRMGSRPRVPVIPPGTSYKYEVPHFMVFQTPLMNWVLDKIKESDFVVSERGGIEMPEFLSKLDIRIANGVYRMGIGGLHSSEKSIAHVATEGYKIYDVDVASYYPSIILNLGLSPSHLGSHFLHVYRDMVARRLAAKRANDNTTSETLKIVINGSYGKLLSKYSALYSPNHGIAVTLTGQLSLLMLIEMFALNSIEVVSANTDGLVIKCHDSQREKMLEIVHWWEQTTNFEIEEAEYSAIYSRDVNNYIAVKKNGGVKGKGAYANPWSDPKLHSFELHKNPANIICVDAVVALLTTGKPVSETIHECRDIRKFVTVRNVKGGAVKDGEFLGGSIRWYYGKKGGEIVYASSGNKVPRSDGAEPLMTLPDEFPDDVDHGWYIEEANKILREIGHS